MAVKVSRQNCLCPLGASGLFWGLDACV